jgi:hypothetical protein
MAINVSCNWQAAFNSSFAKNAIGYLTDFDGLGMSSGLAKDLAVLTQYQGRPQYAPLGAIQNGQVTVAGVLEGISWNGTAGGTVQLILYLSLANAQKLQAANNAPTSKVIQSIGWWVAGYDQRSASWFEQFYPKNPARIAGVVAPGNLDIQPNKVSAGPSRQLIRVSIAIQPNRGGAATCFHWSSAPSASVVLSW